MLKIRTFVGLSLLSVLLACGGGGGGGDNGGGTTPPSTGFRVTLDRSSVSFDYEAGTLATPAVVIASSSGSLSGNLYIGAVAEGEAIDPYIEAVIEGTQARFTLRPKTSLAAGNYSGRVLLKACEDAACSRTIGGTPLPVSYSIRVRPGLSASPNPLEVSAVSGNTAAAVLKVTHPDGPGGSFSDKPISDGAWLRTGAHGVGELPVSFRSMRSGVYQGSIEISTGSRMISVPVKYTVTPPPGGEFDLRASPQSLSLAANEGAASAIQALQIDLPTWGSDTLSFATAYEQPNGEWVQSNSGWLSVQRTATGASVSASAAKLSQGSYKAQILIRPSAPGTAVVVPVSFTVGAGLQKPADQQISIQAQSGSSALQGQTNIALLGTGTVSWTASSDASWLKLLNPNGQTGQALRYQVDASALESLPNFSDSEATITVRPALAAISPVSFKVSLRKALPEVHFAGPYLLLQGQTNQVYLSGRGFNQLQDVASSLQLSGQAASKVSRISDTQLLVEISPTASNSISASIRNTLGLRSDAATLQVGGAQSYAAAAIATPGNKRTILFDAQRQAVYAVNVENQTLERIRFDGSAWQRDVINVPSILDAGIGPDGTQLVVSSKQKVLRLIDASDFSTRLTLNHTPGFLEALSYVSQGIPAGHNGRSWLASGEGWGSTLSYFDHRSQRIVTHTNREAGLAEDFDGGPWLAMARNGERLLVVPNASNTAPKPMLYLDSSIDMLKRNAGNMSWAYEMQLSDDGSRVLFDFETVRDSNFTLLGQLPTLPTGYVRRASAMAPNGTRVYVVAYPSSDMLNPNAPATAVPRVFVYDSSAANPGSLALAEVGQFNLIDYPACRSNEASCIRPRATISPDGQTLFVVGNEKLVVAPIPSALRKDTGARKTGTAATPTLRTYLWRKSAS